MLSTWGIVAVIIVNIVCIFAILCIGAYISERIKISTEEIDSKLSDIQVQLTYNRITVAWVSGDYYHIAQWRENASEEEVRLIREYLNRGKFSGQDVLDKLIE
jgi:hypothetical protein